MGLLWPSLRVTTFKLVKFLGNNSGRIITQFQIIKLWRDIFGCICSCYAINEFQKCGIFPLDPNVFSHANFIAAEVTDILMNPQNNDFNVAR